jgi:putative transposase
MDIGKIILFYQKKSGLMWNWIQKYTPNKYHQKRKKIAEYIINEMVIKVGSGYIWL